MEESLKFLKKIQRMKRSKSGGGKHGFLKRWKYLASECLILRYQKTVVAKLVKPSSRREGFWSIPNVKRKDVEGLDQLRKEFDHYIV